MRHENQRSHRLWLAALALAAVWSAKPAAAQQPRPWTLIGEAGVSDIHGETEAEGAGAAIRLARRVFGYEWLRAEVALTGGNAEEDFGTAELGIELRLCPTCRFTGFVGGGGGLLYEGKGGDTPGDWTGGMLRANVGFEVRLSERFSARAMAQAGTHDGVRGPHLATVGLAWRFGGGAP